MYTVTSVIVMLRTHSTSFILEGGDTTTHKTEEGKINYNIIHVYISLTQTSSLSLSFYLSSPPPSLSLSLSLSLSIPREEGILNPGECLT